MDLFLTGETCLVFFFPKSETIVLKIYKGNNDKVTRWLQKYTYMLNSYICLQDKQSLCTMKIKCWHLILLNAKKLLYSLYFLQQSLSHFIKQYNAVMCLVIKKQ